MAKKRNTKKKPTEGRKPNGQFIKGSKEASRLNLEYYYNNPPLTPEYFVQKCNEYFEITDNNPIQEAAIHQRSGAIIEIPRKRIYSITALCNHLNIIKQTFTKYERATDEEINSIEHEGERDRRRALKILTNRARQIIEAQQLEGGAANIFNSAIVSRILGLADRHEIEDKRDKVITLQVIGNTDAPQPAQIARQKEDSTFIQDAEIVQDAQPTESTTAPTNNATNPDTKTSKQDATERPE